LPSRKNHKNSHFKLDSIHSAIPKYHHILIAVHFLDYINLFVILISI